MSRPKILSPRISNTVCIAVFVVLLIGCRKKASDEIDFGGIANSVYTNKYFGLSVAIPSDWSIQDQESKRRLTSMGKDMVAGDDKNLKAAFKASELQSVNLLVASKHPMGSPVPFNPNIIVLAEMVRQLPGIQRGKDYHYQVKKTLESGQMQVSFPKEGYTERLGGVDFDVMETEMKLRGSVIRQKLYASIKTGYALCFIASFTTKEEEASLQKILDTVAFK